MIGKHLVLIWWSHSRCEDEFHWISLNLSGYVVASTARHPYPKLRHENIKTLIGNQTACYSAKLYIVYLDLPCSTDPNWWCCHFNLVCTYQLQLFNEMQFCSSFSNGVESRSPTSDSSDDWIELNMIQFHGMDSKFSYSGFFHQVIAKYSSQYFAKFRNKWENSVPCWQMATTRVALAKARHPSLDWKKPVLAHPATWLTEAKIAAYVPVPLWQLLNKQISTILPKVSSFMRNIVKKWNDGSLLHRFYRF